LSSSVLPTPAQNFEQSDIGGGNVIQRQGEIFNGGQDQKIQALQDILRKYGFNGAVQPTPIFSGQ
jgi:hypothetical protein